LLGRSHGMEPNFFLQLASKYMPMAMPNQSRNETRSAVEGSGACAGASDNGDELPEGWTRVELGEFIASMANGVYKPEKYYTATDGVPCLRMYNIQDGQIVLHNVKQMRLSRSEIEQYELLPGDLLVNRVNSRELVGKAAICPSFRDRTVFESKNIRVRLNDKAVDPRYVNLFLQTSPARQQLSDSSKQTVGMATVSQPLISALIVSFPPLAEQQRIVAKVETLLARVNAARQRLAKVPRLLKRFRQSVLAAACSGRLTTDWRDRQLQCSEEDAVRQRADAFRREYWEKLQLARMQSRGEQPSDERWKRGYDPPKFDPPRDLPDLPERWQWVPLGLLGENPIETVQTGPFGAQLHNDEFVPEGVPVIAVGNLTGMGFKTEGLYFITPQKARQLDRYDVQGGDVLFARSGATLGKVCVIPYHVKDWRMTGHILRARVNSRFVLPEIVVYALHGDASVRSQISEGVRGITRPGFNTGLLESILVPVAPIAEQHEIICRVDRLFRLVDAIEKRVAAATARAEKLTQAILAKAFRGELVPTEAELARREGRSYEPASVLLERIRAERNGDKDIQNGSQTEGDTRPVRENERRSRRARKPKTA
jgi:type I restriction enzyme, S subunit